MNLVYRPENAALQDRPFYFQIYELYLKNRQTGECFGKTLDSYLRSIIIFASVNIKSASMMAQTKYKIGEFSRLGRVTVRTLRHYEKIGLLKPGIVDMWTGYRYYGPDQLQKLLSIVQLKQLGFSLAEITELYENDTHYPDIRALESKIRACEEELQTLKARHAQLKSLVAAHKKRMNMEKIYFDSLPSITVAYNRTILPNYDALGMHLVTVVAPEMARLGCSSSSQALILDSRALMSG